MFKTMQQKLQGSNWHIDIIFKVCKG